MPHGLGGSKKAAKTGAKSLAPKGPVGITKPPIRRLARSYTMTRTQAYGFVRTVGTNVAIKPDLKAELPKFTFVKAQRLSFLDRSVEDETGKLVKSETFGSRYRSTWGAQDELLSTASVRNLINGLLNGRTRTQIPKEEWELFRTLVDCLSALRIPTKYSGFSTAKEVMQHPTEKGEGFFSKEAVFGPHGTYDSARVKYVGDAVRLSQANGASAVEQLRAAARAAIEFSLNYFTAPITASNVQPFSTKKGVSHDDESLLDQISARESIKDLYVAFGGDLRALEPPPGEDEVEETPEQSLSRVWQRDLPITTADPFPFAPPSPRRERRKSDKTQAEPKSSVKLSSGGAVNATGFGASLFSAPSTQASSSSTTSAFGVTSSSSGKTQAPTKSKMQALGQGPVIVGMVRIPPLVLPVPPPTATKSRSLLDDVLTGISVGASSVRKRSRSAEDELEPPSRYKRVRGEDLQESLQEDMEEYLGESPVDLGDAFGIDDLEPLFPSLEPSAPAWEDEDLMQDLTQDLFLPSAPLEEDEDLMQDVIEPSAPPFEYDDPMAEFLGSDGFAPENEEYLQSVFEPSAPPLEDADLLEAMFPSVPTTPLSTDAAMTDTESLLAQMPPVPTHTPAWDEFTSVEESAMKMVNPVGDATGEMMGESLMSAGTAGVDAGLAATEEVGATVSDAALLLLA